MAVLAGMPREPTHNYGFIWPTRHGLPMPQDQIGLTIAGLRHVQAASSLVTGLCSLISALGTIRSEIALDPFANERPRVTMRQAAEVESKLRGFPIPRIDKSFLPFLTKEPSAWNCQVVDNSSDDWVIELSPVIRRFAGLKDVDDYLDRLNLVLIPGDEAATSLFVSPFTLPAALDYLDTVWRLKFKAGLLVPPGIERSARLAFDVSTSEEADSALSALAEVLKSLQVPGGSGGHPLQRLGPFLANEISPEAMPSVDDAIALLNAVRQLRASSQHVGAQPEAVSAFARLGLVYPVSDWGMAWRQVQGAVGHACDILRRELHASL